MNTKKKQKIGLVLKLDRGSFDDHFVGWSVFVGIPSQANRAKGDIFIPSNHVQELLGSGKLKEHFESVQKMNKWIREGGLEVHRKEYLGHVMVKFIRLYREIQWNVFYPFFVNEPLFIGKGLGSLINAAILAKLKKQKQFQGYKIGHSKTVERPRRTQLKKMGLNADKLYDINTGFEKSRDYLRKIFAKHSARRKRMH